MQKLAHYWATDYDWRKTEAKLNALSAVHDEHRWVDIHFIHVRSKHAERFAGHHHARLAGLDHRAAEDHRAADRSRLAHGGKAEDSFDVVIPSLPGYGFSESRPRPAGIPFASRAPGSC